MNQSAVNPKSKTLASTTIAIILGFALVMFFLNLEASRVSASSNDSTSTQAISDTAGPLVIEVAPRIAVIQVGDTLTVVATVTTAESQPVANAIVNFEVLVGPNLGLTGLPNTNDKGEAPFTYSSSSEGIDIIQACVITEQTLESTAVQTVDSTSERACELSVKWWVGASPQREIDLAPESASNPVDTIHTVTATVSTGVSTNVSSSEPDRESDRASKGKQSPVSDALVDFEVISGPTVGATGSAATDSNGQALFSYTGTAIGLDTIRACTDGADGRVCDSAANKWTGDQPPPDGTSCQGEHSCRGRIVSVGADSCNGENSCNGDDISIGDNSCNEEDSCRGNANSIGNRSCNGEESCRGNSQQIGDDSCNDKKACRGNGNQIGDGSCNGEKACAGNNMVVEANQCNQDKACRNSGKTGQGDPGSGGNDQQNGNTGS